MNFFTFHKIIIHFYSSTYTKKIFIDKVTSHAKAAMKSSYFLLPPVFDKIDILSS